MTQGKVLLIVESSAAGVGRHVIDLAAGLLERQFEVHIAYSTLRMDATFARGIRDLVRQWRQAFVFPLLLEKNVCWSDVSMMMQLRRYIRRRGPFDVIHTHSTKAGLVGRLSALGLGGRRIHTPHAPLTMSPAVGSGTRKVVAVLERSLALATNAIIAVSGEEEDHLAKLGISARQLYLVRNGVAPPDPGKTSAQRRIARSRFGVQDGEVCIGFVGRLVAQKNVELLLRAFARMKEAAATSSRLVIVGDGPLYMPLRRLSGSLGIAGSVSWLGEMPGHLMMAGFDVFALSSCYEGCPYVLLEALSAGLPIVSTMVGGASCAVKHGENGYLVPVGDEMGLSSAMLTILLSPSLRNAMASESRRISTTYSIDNMIERTTGVYRIPRNKANLAQEPASLAVGIQR